MIPPRRITDPAFRYTPSDHTDIRKTFARIRREQKAEAVANAEQALKVLPIRKKEGA